MNILPVVRDRLDELFEHVRTRFNSEGECIAVEITIKIPNEKDRRYLMVRITQDDNILEMALHNLTGHLPHMAPKVFDLVDPDFFDQIVHAINLYKAFA